MQQLAESPAGHERRLETRHPVEVQVFWTDGNRARKGEVLDASDHGLFLKPAWQPSDPLTGGDEIEMRCRVRDREFDLKGEICWLGRSAWHETDGLGLRITSAATLKRLLDFLSGNSA